MADNVKILKIDNSEYKLDAFNADHAAEAGHAASANFATKAGKVNGTLTLKVAGTTKATYDGSASKTFDVTAADLGLSNALHFLGISTTDPAAGTATVGGKAVTPVAGDVVIYKRSGETRYEEYVYVDDTNKWELLGDADSHSIKGHTHSFLDEFTATGLYTPAGDVSQPTFTGTQNQTTTAFNKSYTPAGSVSTIVKPEGTISHAFNTTNNATHKHTFTGNNKTVNVSGTASGSISINYTPKANSVTPTFTATTATGGATHNHTFNGTSGTVNVTGNLANGTATVNVPKLNHINSHSYTPAGSISTPTFTGTQATITVKGNTAGGITLTNASASSGTTVVKNVSVTNNTTTVVTGVSGSASGGKLTAQQNGITLTLNTTAVGVSINTTNASVINKVTPTVTYTTIGFSPSEMTATGSYTPAGNVSKPTFTGTVATLTHTFDFTNEEITGNVTGTVASTGSFTPAGTISRQSLSIAFAGKAETLSSALIDGTVSASGDYQPEGTISTVSLASTFAGTEKEYAGNFIGTATNFNHTHNFTATGTVSKPTFTGTQANITVSGTVSGTTSSDVE